MGGWSMIVFYILIFGIMYFFMLRPQIKKQKLQNEFGNQLKKGDQVATTSGIIGRITKIEENIVELQLDGKTFIRVLKSAISKEATDSLPAKQIIE